MSGSSVWAPDHRRTDGRAGTKSMSGSSLVHPPVNWPWRGGAEQARPNLSERRPARLAEACEGRRGLSGWSLRAPARGSDASQPCPVQRYLASGAAQDRQPGGFSNRPNLPPPEAKSGGRTENAVRSCWTDGSRRALGGSERRRQGPRRGKHCYRAMRTSWATFRAAGVGEQRSSGR
jgi:hypothetical protein